MDKNPNPETTAVPPIIPIVERSISPSGKFVIIISLIWCVCDVIYFSHRTTLMQFVTMPLSLLFLIALIMSLYCANNEWPKRRWHSRIPLAACVLAFFLSIFLTHIARSRLFLQNLPSYKAVVYQIESGNFPVSTAFERIPEATAIAKTAYVVFAQKETNGTVTVEFWTEGGFPVKHSGYLYQSSGSITPHSSLSSRWPRLSPVQTNWFYFSD